MTDDHAPDDPTQEELDKLNRGDHAPVWNYDGNYWFATLDENVASLLEVEYSDKVKIDIRDNLPLCGVDFWANILSMMRSEKLIIGGLVA